MYAVIELQGHQFIVKQGDKIDVDFIGQDIDSTIEAPVLATFDENGLVSLGTPYVKEVATVKIVTHFKGEKIKVMKFKRKNRYARSIGFRHKHSTVLVESIS